MKKLLVLAVMAWAAAAFGASQSDVSGIHAEALQLKTKIESGVGLTDAELARALEITRETGNQFDLRRAKPGAPSKQPERPRPPANPLDEYIWAPIDYEWVDISDIGTNAGIAGDDQMSVPFDLGFNFTFYNQPYSQVFVASNGWVSFLQPDWATYANQTIPDNFDPHATIYGIWDDLYPPSGGQILYYADAANQRFIISWLSIDHYPGTGEFYTFQIVINSTGNIVLSYETIPTGGQNGNTSCTAGIENETSTEGVEVCNEGGGTLPVSGSSILIGQPDGVPGPITNLTSQVVGEDVVFNWANPTQDTNGNPVTLDNVQVWWGLPQSGILLATLGGTATTYTHVNPPDGNHDYHVRAYANPYYGPMASIDQIVGNPSYVQDFETNSGLWETTEGWEWGDITNPNLFGAHSGTKVWAVGLNDFYPGGACYTLDLDVGLTVSSPTATIEFWISYNVQNFFDGVNMKSSIDGGQTWEMLEPENGYRMPALYDFNPCIPSESAWSDFNIHNWEPVEVPIGHLEGEAPMFRFTFGSTDGFSGPGFAFDDMIIWGLAPPVWAPISGTVTLDGGAGNMTSVLVQSNGLGAPTTNPAANGTYNLSQVLVGNRIVQASLPGYHGASANVTLGEGGATGVNLTLVRLDPPAPVGLTGSVNNDNGLVTLDWPNSTDPLVDSYNLYRRVQGEQIWTMVGNVVPSNATHQLPVDGVYDMAITAIDDDVSTPVESEMSEDIRLLYGAIPPTGLYTSGNYDDRIRLFWFAPGTPPEFEVFYDDGSWETNIGWFGLGTSTWFASRFVANDAATVNRIKVFFTSQAFPGDPFAVGVFDDNGGMPGNLLAEIESSHEAPFDEFREFELEEPVTIEGGTFYIGVKQLNFNPVSIGGDMSTPFMESTFYYTFDQTFWTPIEFAGWLAIPMVRCFASGDFEQEVEMVPSPVELPTLAVSNSTVDGTSWARTIADGKFASGSNASKGSSAKGAKSEKQVQPLVLHEDIPATSGRLSSTNNPAELRRRANEAVQAHAPNLNPVSDRDPNHSLDDLDYYIVYRNGVDIAHPTATPYFDLGRTENVDYTYTIAAHYDNGDLSATVGPVIERCNMAPAAATNLTGVPQGNTQMRLSWTNPTLNADATPLVDLAGTRIFRNGTQIGQVGAGVTEYIDTPPENDQMYSWTVVSLDEVPNLSSESIPYQGFVVSPFEIVDYEWIDIGDIGLSTGISGDDHTVGPFDLGFEIEFMGIASSQVWICSNGWVTFSETFSATYFNEPIPSINEPNHVAFAFWDDLYPPSGGQFLYYADAVENRFVMSWIDVPHIGTTDELYTFQIVIGDDGSITYNYNLIHEGGFYGNTTCTVGVEEAGGTNGIQVCYDNTGSFIPTSETAIAFWAGPSGEINGTVREFSTNSPIQNAEVSVEGGEDIVFTDNAGNFILEVDPGTYTLNVHKQGYCDESFANIVVQDDGIVSQNASMRQPNVQFNVTSLNMIAAINQNTSTTFELSNPTTSTICPLEYSITDNAAWLTCTPATGTVPNGGVQVVTVSANVQGMPFGDYNAVINVAHNDNASPSTIPVTLSISLTGEDGATIPTEFAFHQNYPNPFNATTSLLFDLPNESRVDISIFNVMGQEVAHPVSEVYPAGAHSVSYTAEGLPSGMYLVKMSAGSFSALNKMVLLK